jgi:MFS family permease
VLPLVQLGLGAGTTDLGIVLGAFLVGVGLFQIPAGFASFRWGPRAVSLAGLTLMGAAGAASAFAPSIPALAIARFLAGSGAAFFFAPGLALVARYFPPGERGPVIGLYNGAFSVGGAIGLFGGAAAGALFGWRFALGVGGAILLLATAAVALAVPPDPRTEPRPSLATVLRQGRQVLRSRSLWALALGLTGFWGAVYVVSQFLVQYAYAGSPGWGTGTAAALAAGVVLASFPGGPVGGWLGERARDRRRPVGLYAALTGLLVFVVPFAPLPLVAVALIALGFFDGLVFAAQYLMPSYFLDTQGEGVALAIGLLNSVQVLLGSGIAIAFAFLIEPLGWAGAWLFAGAVALGLLPLLALVRATDAIGRPAAGAVGAGASSRRG